MRQVLHVAGFLIFVVAISSTLSAATITVAKNGSGKYSTIMEAIRKAGPGDVIQIIDAAVYPEQVTIDHTKTGLTLTSKNPTSLNKPTILWRDTVNTHPWNATEALDTNMFNFYKNGALQLLRVSHVTIDGIKIDGGGCYPFGHNAVWDGRYALQHGNTGMAVYISGDVIIKNCDISNAYIGISFIDFNEGGIFANANPIDPWPWRVIPLSGFGKTGNHLVEYNRIHNNSLGLFFESIWDMGSAIRYNLIYENHHATDALAAQIKNLTVEGQQQPGGAFEFKDHMLSPLAIYNNTFWHNKLLFCGNWRPGGQHLIFNNIYGAPVRYWTNDPNYSNAGSLDI